MPNLFLLRLAIRLSASSPSTTGGARLFTSFYQRLRSYSEEQTRCYNGSSSGKIKGKWLTLPPFDGTADGAAMGREASQGGAAEVSTAAAATTALKWVSRCCPELPRSLVQKLFRLRQVRRDVSGADQSGVQQLKRYASMNEDYGRGLCFSLQLLLLSVINQSEIRIYRKIAAKDSMDLGDRIYLPITVKESYPKKQEKVCHFDSEEQNFVRSLVIYKDSSIIAINKPPGMAVQGGIGIKRSLDELAATCLKYDYMEPPRLVHRLDRDSSGILVMGRTRTSATFLHAIFREKTIGATNNVDISRRKRVLQRRYWALVLGKPRHSKGVISAPLGKVVVDNGKSERITIIDNDQLHSISTQHAITEYQVIDSCHGYSWLELSPLTGRKHQLRVHCAEVLGTPIVGDYKYGWQAHRRKWEQFLPSASSSEHNVAYEEESSKGGPKEKALLPFGLDLETGSICDKQQPRLHLHCKQIHIPDISAGLENPKHYQEDSRYDLSELESLELVAPLPPYMRKSLDSLNAFID